MDANVGTVAELHEVRISGRQWCIAMRGADWARFCSDIPEDAHFRLQSAFNLFCEQGGDNLPEQLFHRVAGDPGARLEEFVAFGVHVIGRRATEDPLRTFYVTEMRWSGAVPQVERPLPVQQVLPLSAAPTLRGESR